MCCLIQPLVVGTGISVAILAARLVGRLLWGLVRGRWPGLVAGVVLGGAASFTAGFWAARLIWPPGGVCWFMAAFCTLPGMILGGFGAKGIDLGADVDVSA